MNIIKSIKIDVELSKFFASKLDYDLKGRCYENVYSVIDYLVEENKIQGNLEVAYGYVGKSNIRMFRHCFLVLDRNKIIDPTLSEKVDNETEYHIFKLLNIKEYVELLTKFYKSEELNVTPTMEGIIPEENNYCEYAISNEIVIDEDSYREFLKQYDKEGKVRIFNMELECYLLYKKDTEGKVLTKNEVQSLKDGTELWIEGKVPVLVTKRKNILQSIGDTNLIYSISEVEKKIIVKEYINKDN